jgi:hypothetical protein
LLIHVGRQANQEVSQSELHRQIKELLVIAFFEGHMRHMEAQMQQRWVHEYEYGKGRIHMKLCNSDHDKKLPVELRQSNHNLFPLADRVYRSVASHDVAKLAFVLSS